MKKALLGLLIVALVLSTTGLFGCSSSEEVEKQKEMELRKKQKELLKESMTNKPVKLDPVKLWPDEPYKPAAQPEKQPEPEKSKETEEKP